MKLQHLIIILFTTAIVSSFWWLLFLFFPSTTTIVSGRNRLLELIHLQTSKRKELVAPDAGVLDICQSGHGDLGDQGEDYIRCTAHFDTHFLDQQGWGAAASMFPTMRSSQAQTEYPLFMKKERVKTTVCEIGQVRLDTSNIITTTESCKKIRQNDVLNTPRLRPPVYDLVETVDSHYANEMKKHSKSFPWQENCFKKNILSTTCSSSNSIPAPLLSKKMLENSGKYTFELPAGIGHTLPINIYEEDNPKNNPKNNPKHRNVVVVNRPTILHIRDEDSEYFHRMIYDLATIFENVCRLGIAPNDIDFDILALDPHGSVMKQHQWIYDIFSKTNQKPKVWWYNRFDSNSVVDFRNSVIVGSSKVQTSSCSWNSAARYFAHVPTTPVKVFDKCLVSLGPWLRSRMGVQEKNQKKIVNIPKTIKVFVVFRKSIQKGRFILNQLEFVAGLQQLIATINQNGGILSTTRTGKKYVHRRHRIPVTVELKYGDFNLGNTKEARKFFMEDMQDTDVLVGMHGAAFANMMFLPPRAAVVELFNYGHFQPMYHVLSNAFGLSHWMWQNTNTSRHFPQCFDKLDTTKCNADKYANTILNVDQVVGLVGRAVNHVVRERQFSGL